MNMVDEYEYKYGTLRWKNVEFCDEMHVVVLWWNVGFLWQNEWMTKWIFVVLHCDSLILINFTGSTQDENDDQNDYPDDDEGLLIL